MSPQLPAALDTIDLFGFYVPSLMLWAAVAWLLTGVICWGLRLTGVYRFVWHRALFDIALYLIILGTIVLGSAGDWPVGRWPLGGWPLGGGPS